MNFIIEFLSRIFSFNHESTNDKLERHEKKLRSEIAESDLCFICLEYLTHETDYLRSEIIRILSDNPNLNPYTIYSVRFEILNRKLIVKH